MHYWRDKQGREADFVLPRGRDAVDVIECKWDPAALDGSALEVFRRYYPKGRNWLCSPSAVHPWVKRVGSLESPAHPD